MENPLIGMILCSAKDDSLVRYAIGALLRNVMTGEYLITLPDETMLARGLDRVTQAMELCGNMSLKAPASSVGLPAKDTG